MDSTGSNSFVLLMIPGRRFFYDEPKVTALFLELFCLTLIHRAMVYLAAVSMSTVHGADLPNILRHHLCSFSGPSFSYLTENWVGNIFIGKLFSGHIPFSLSVQHPLLVCAVLPCQHGSITDTDWTHSHSQTEMDTMKDDVPSEMPILKPMDVSVT